MRQTLWIFLLFLSLAPFCCPQNSTPEKIIIDTDIGDDVDDAFAVALALRSPELQILGITTAFGDTETRAKLLDRLLGETGHSDIPVGIGIHTQATSFTQRAYAEAGHFARTTHPQAVDFILDQIRKNPGKITLVGIGPLVNIGALIDRDKETFRKLRRVVLMGGSVYRGYGDQHRPPEPEWNIDRDPASAKALFTSGVPIVMLPLDSTQIQLGSAQREQIFAFGSPLTDQLTLLYHQWGQKTPTLFDPMTIAFLVNPSLCPVQPMHIRIDDKGFTRPEPGPPNAQVCLDSNPDSFFRFYLNRVAAP